MSDFRNSPQYAALVAAQEVFMRSETGSKNQEKKLAKWQKRTREALQEVQTLGDAMDVYHLAPWMTEEERFALEKVCEFLKRVKYGRIEPPL